MASFHSRGRMCHLACFILILGILSQVFAEETRPPLPDQVTFTLESAAAYGLVHNPALRAMRNEIGVAEGELIDVALLENPDIEVAYSHERSRERAKEDGSVVKGHARTLETALTQSINIAGGRPARILQARAELDAARAEIAQEEVELVKNIKQAAAEYVGHTHGLGLLHNVVFGVKPLMAEAIKDRSDDQSRAQMGFLDNEQDDINDRLEVMESETELNTLLGLPADTRLFIEDSLDPLPIPVGYEDLRKAILSRNLEVKSALAELRAARHALSAAMRDRVPDLEGSVSRAHTHETSTEAAAHSTEYGFGGAAALKLFNQNQGEIKAAKSEAERARLELEATRWEVGNELYATYQTLNVARVRIRVLERGYLANLKKLIEEDDMDLYEARKIEFATWERDLMRYHEDGEELIEAKVEYKKTVAELEALAGGSFKSAIQVPEEGSDPENPPAGYLAGAGLKVGRGFANVLLSPIELPASWFGNVRDRGVAGVIVGPFDGIITAAERAGAGLVDIATSPVPWPLEKNQPVSQPVMGKDPWHGSWSLQFFHPPYQAAATHFHPSYEESQEKAPTEKGK